ncbi:helix-turn-helix transcriptional regulator [Paeniglutamicibacter psychrophenolicus]|uniref:helix-turn-helix transcriptional regulator n=1 Tax=Paeniglutamicibacter psychrophenolicus TaxID=257454 RepID=UPI00278789CF|nr:helix-turn-helix domain-containing protein [Paeniglutamicibacter psychrophenolicus]MDQ0094416.1 putative DNA-binding transcriptional regulator AlpA [Paeniglutamicibacter psychrophenolicus]
MNTETHQLMTMAEVAEMTRIPENTLRYYRHKETGPKSAKIGGRVMYRRADVDAWINEAFDKAAS